MIATATPVTIKSMFGLLYSLIFAFISALGVNVTYTSEMPSAKEDFTPAIRFVVCTDSHNNNENIVNMIETCYQIYGEDGIDLFCHCGDFTEIGTEGEMIKFKEAWFGAINGRSQSLIIMGNHDLKQGYDAHDKFCEIFGVQDSKQHITVNGFHFIGLPSYTQSALQLAPVSAIEWAKDELAKAEADSNNLPVFSFQHPHNEGTVYGSVIWGSLAYSDVWSGHSRVVNFSGHSHFPISDPRSIFQSTYTTVGAGAMERYELEKDLIWGQHPAGYEDAAEFYVVEADMNGSVKLSAYDLNTNTFFLEYYIENVNDTSTFAYTYKNRMTYDEAPVFAEDASAEITINDKNETVIDFTRASDKLIVHDYKVYILDELGFPIYIGSHLSDYYLQGVPERMNINLGKTKLNKGDTCYAVLIATNAYYEVSEPKTIKVCVK